MKRFRVICLGCDGGILASGQFSDHADALHYATEKIKEKEIKQVDIYDIDKIIKGVSS